MTANQNHLMLGFATEFGKFVIEPYPNEKNIFILKLETGAAQNRKLNAFRSINDAILAVANQETGVLEWDGLCFNKVPYKVHDITCWEFFEFSGTNQSDQCSHAIG
jgi:hypothetical protein